MNLDTTGWKEFQIGELFQLVRGHTLTVEQQEEYAGSISCVNGTVENNGIQYKLSKNIERMGFKLIKAPAITIVRVGNGGKTFVQTEDFYIADNAFALVSLNNISVYSMMFISALLDNEQIKYSYGRTVTNNYEKTIIKLPTDLDDKPDWDYMENYIKSLHYKPLTTNNKKSRIMELNMSQWKDYRIRDILDCNTTALSIKDNLPEGDIPFVSRTAENNGIDGFVDVGNNKLTEGNCITVGAEGIYAFYQSQKFATGNKVYQIRCNKMNKYVGIFISTVLNLEDYRYSYGRARIISKLKNEVIRLPADENGEPDWHFMEEYIKSLPYGDRI